MLCVNKGVHNSSHQSNLMQNYTLYKAKLPRWAFSSPTLHTSLGKLNTLDLNTIKDMNFRGEFKSNFRQTPKSARSMKFLRLQEILLHLIGYSVRPNEPVIWKLGSHLGLYLLTTHLFPESYYIYDNLSDIKKTTDGLCPCLFGLSTIIKMFTLLLRRSRFYAVVWKIKDLTNSGNINITLDCILGSFA